MKKIFFSLLINLLIYNIYAQTAPAHLKYFGFAGVDVFLDDPHDTVNITNYISEVDSFSNFADMSVNDYMDTVITRVNLMNNHCVKAALSIQNVFYFLADSNAPSGNHYKLRSDYLARWNVFKNINSVILDSSRIIAFYVFNEPFWNGVSFGELDTVCALLKNDFPGILTFIAEAYTAINNLQVPVSIDLLAFDRYGVFDPSTDPTYLNELNILKSKRSTPHQKIILIADDQWFSGFWPVGWQPDTIQYVFQNYYTLAASDPDIVGLVGFIWPGGVPDLGPTSLGVRDLPQAVIDKNVQIGKMIKENYSPCAGAGMSVENYDQSKEQFIVFPNPTSKFIIINSRDIIYKIEIRNLLGDKIHSSKVNATKIEIDLGDHASGSYLLNIKTENKSFMKKLIIQK